jgi:Ni/Co efflux regulator RcnB
MKTLHINKANWSGEEIVVHYYMNNRNQFIAKSDDWYVVIDGKDIKVREIGCNNNNFYRFSMTTPDGGKTWIATDGENTREADHPVIAAMQLAYLLI